MKFNWLIVGAGFSACVLAERIAGNAYDYYNEHGLLVHKYGPHIFHAKSK